MLNKLLKNKFILSNKLIKEYNQTRAEPNRNLPVCLAPYKSLRFLPDGNMTVCCHNNSWSVGTYPQTSILEAWSSKEKLKLQKKISKADFSLGCYECLPAFINKNFASTNTSLYENYEINNKFPVILDFKIATECNLECIMCSEYSSSAIRKSCHSGNDASLEFGDNFIRQISELIPYIKEARFSGGEPFLNNIYFDIWDMIILKNPECKISIQTNGTILNQKIKSLMELGNFHINVSIDSANPEVYTLIRRNGDFNKLIENLKYFATYSQKRKVLLGITSCNMRDNAYELPGILSLANTLKAKLWYSDVYFPLVNALWAMNSKDLDNIVSFLENKSFESDSEIANHNYIVYQDMISRIKNFAYQAKQREEKSDFIIAAELKKKLKKIFKENIKTNPELWVRIEKLIDVMGNSKVINLADEIENYYKSDFVYSQLGLMSDSDLVKNFECLKF